MKKSTARTIIIVTIAILGLITAGAVFSLYQITIMPWWLPLLVGILFAGITYPILILRWNKITGNSSRGINTVFHIITMGILGATLFLAFNYFGADDNTLTPVQTTVNDKYRKAHQKRRRVGRNRYINDGYWYSYRLSLQLPDGNIKDIEVPHSEYRRTKIGTTKTIGMETGLFRFPIIKRSIPSDIKK